MNGIILIFSSALIFSRQFSAVEGKKRFIWNSSLFFVHFWIPPLPPPLVFNWPKSQGRLGLKFLFFLIGSTCPLDCQCLPYTDCKWADENLKLQTIHEENSPVREFYKSKFIRNICDKSNKGLCCCGIEQVSPEDYNGTGENCNKMQGRGKVWKSVGARSTFAK